MARKRPARSLRDGRTAGRVPQWCGLNVGVGQEKRPIRDVQWVDGASDTKRLRLVADTDDTHPDFMGSVRAIRRSMARFLRALHASGHGTTSWPDGFVSRLAHADAVTARYLAEPDRVDLLAVHAAAESLHAIEIYVTSTLSRRERAQLRTFELAIRIDSDSLAHPLLRPDSDPEEGVAMTEASGFPRPCSLRAGLAAISDEDLGCIATRLGLLRGSALAGIKETRLSIEQDIGRLLRDDHLLGILIATLPRDTLELLAGLVRGSFSVDELQGLAREDEVAKVVGDRPRALCSSIILRTCGLAFTSAQADDEVERLWVPVELRHRVDGVLRALAV